MTKVEIKGEDFYINGKKTYSEIEGSQPKAHGLLMNARFIQGVFDDKAQPERFNRFGKEFNPDRNTDDLVKALPQWYKYGLRAFTVGFQGGGTCFTIKSQTIDNNPFGEDGRQLDLAYQQRMDKLIRAADRIGMGVIVSFFYPGQLRRIKDGRSVVNAVKTACRFLKEKGYTNVIIEVCNEMDVDKAHTIIHKEEGMAVLIDIAREESGGMLVGCSGAGGSVFKEVAEASDIVLIHGNGLSRQQLYKMIQKTREYAPGKPIVCNEDSQAIGQLKVCYNEHVSWGYYNNMTKQEPPVDWGITKGEDQFFAYRMAEGIGINIPDIPMEEQYYLQGLEKAMTYENKRWLRVASLYPESIDYVEFYKNDELLYTSYDEPFSLNFYTNWLQGEIIWEDTDSWKAKIHLINGKIIEK